MSSSADPRLLWYVLAITVIGVAALLVGIAASRLIRKRLLSETRGVPFTIQDLREMRADGSITQQEYETMRAAIIAQMGSDSPAAPPAAPEGHPPSGAESDDATEDRFADDDAR